MGASLYKRVAGMPGGDKAIDSAVGLSGAANEQLFPSPPSVKLGAQRAAPSSSQEVRRARARGGGGVGRGATSAHTTCWDRCSTHGASRVAHSRTSTDGHTRQARNTAPFSPLSDWGWTGWNPMALPAGTPH